MKRFFARLIAIALVFVMSFQLASCSFEQDPVESICESKTQSSDPSPKISVSTLEPSADGLGYITKTESYQLDQAVGVHEPTDYTQLHALSSVLEKIQDYNAVLSSEVAVIYISPELVKEWRCSEQSFEEFFGYSTHDLLAQYGTVGLTFSSTGEVSKGLIIHPIQENTTYTDYNIDALLKKVAIGTAIILVGATITTLSGGSFSCALLSISRTAVSASVMAGATTVMYETALNYSQGKNLAAAFESSCVDGLDAMGDFFIVGSVLGSIATITNPTSVCFTGDTLVATEDGYKPIKDIGAGTLVWATDPECGQVALKPVVRSFVNETTELVHVTVGSEELRCTKEHPFYSPLKGWVAAHELREGEILVSLSGESAVVNRVIRETLKKPIPVYNLEIADYHTYHVGSNSVLVHNQCHIGDVDTYGKLKQHDIVGDGIEHHHVPSQKYMLENFGVQPKDAMAISISASDHRRTFTAGGNRLRDDYYLSLPASEALRVDLSNLRAIFRENGNLEEMLPFLDELVASLKKTFPHIPW